MSPREIDFEHHVYCPIDGLVDYDGCLGCEYFVERDDTREVVRCNYVGDGKAMLDDAEARDMARLDDMIAVTDRDAETAYDGARADHSDRELMGGAVLMSRDDREIRIYRDGDKWCALREESLKEGEAGFGATPEIALMALLVKNEAWSETYPAAARDVPEMMKAALAILNRIDNVCEIINCDKCLAAFIDSDFCAMGDAREGLIRVLCKMEADA